MPFSAELDVDVDSKIINIVEGGNFDPEYLKIVSGDFWSLLLSLSSSPFLQNPAGTLPALSHDGKSFGSTATVIDYLVSISSKKVAPATAITTEVHDPKLDPNFAFVASVRYFFPQLLLFLWGPCVDGAPPTSPL